MEHAVDQRRGHGLDDCAVLRTVARTDDDAPRREVIFSDALFVDQAVECLLHLLRAGVQLVQKEYIRLLAGDHFRRHEFRGFALDLRDADDVLRRELTAEEGHAFHPHIVCKLLDECRFADTRCSPDEHRADGGQIQEQVG